MDVSLHMSSFLSPFMKCLTCSPTADNIAINVTNVKDIVTVNVYLAGRVRLTHNFCPLDALGKRFLWSLLGTVTVNSMLEPAGDGACWQPAGDSHREGVMEPAGDSHGWH